MNIKKVFHAYYFCAGILSEAFSFFFFFLVLFNLLSPPNNCTTHGNCADNCRKRDEVHSKYKCFDLPSYCFRGSSRYEISCVNVFFSLQFILGGFKNIFFFLQIISKLILWTYIEIIFHSTILLIFLLYIGVYQKYFPF